MSLNNFEHFIISKIAYVTSFIGYLSLQITPNFVLPNNPLFNNFLKFLFGLLLFIITYFLKHWFDKKLKK